MNIKQMTTTPKPTNNMNSIKDGKTRTSSKLSDLGKAQQHKTKQTTLISLGRSVLETNDKKRSKVSATEKKAKVDLRDETFGGVKITTKALAMMTTILIPQRTKKERKT